MKGIFYLFLFTFILISACDEQNGPEIQGSENIISETRELDSFSSIHIASVINANITKGSQDVSIRANDNILELITTEVKDGILYIDLEDGNYGEISITANISTTDLFALTTTGVNNVIVSQVEEPNEIELNLEGVGNIEMSGSAGAMVINSSGAINLEAFSFIVTNCEINLTGVGNVQITVTDELSGALSGVGNILYKGSPQIDVNVTGVGNIVNAN